MLEEEKNLTDAIVNIENPTSKLWGIRIFFLHPYDKTTKIRRERKGGERKAANKLYNEDLTTETHNNNTTITQQL